MLYVVPTPIGNLEDITFRAIKTLQNVDFIIAENTRSSQKLLKRYDINTKLISYHQHNEHKVVNKLVKEIATKNAAIISDAGTPGISDAGFLLIKECIKNKIKVETLPGATAFIPALINSGFACDRFYFHGFLPHKKGKQKELEYLNSLKCTVIFYESPHRLLKTLEQMLTIFGKDRLISVSREITKIYEETIRGTITEVIDYYKTNTVKGEFVVVVS